MAELLQMNLPDTWVITHHGFINENPFDELGERNFSVSEDLFQANLVNLTLDIGFYRTEYQVRLIEDFDWENPLFSQNCKTRFEAKQIAESIAIERTNVI